MLLHEPAARATEGNSDDDGSTAKLIRRVVLDWNPASSIASSHELLVTVLKFDAEGAMVFQRRMCFHVLRR